MSRMVIKIITERFILNPLYQITTLGTRLVTVLRSSDPKVRTQMEMNDISSRSVSRLLWTV